MYLQDPMTVEIPIESSYLSELRACCRDDQAFSRLLHLLTQMQWDLPTSTLSVSSPLEQTQAQLENSQNRYQAILDAIPDRMFRLSRAGVYLDFKGDPVVDRDIPPGALIGKTLEDLVPLDVAQLCRNVIGQTLATNTIQRCDYQLMTPIGMRDFEARVTVSGADEVLMIVRDITERKQFERERQAAMDVLAASEMRFAKIFQANPGGICITTFAEGRILELNHSFEQISGYTRAEVLEHTTLELNLWVDLSHRHRILQELADQGWIRDQEVQFRRKSGEYGIGIVSADVIQLNEQTCVLAVLTDVTESKRTEAQLRAVAERDRLLGQVAMRIHQSLDLDTILSTTVTEIRHVMQTDQVWLCFCDPETQELVSADSIAPNWSGNVKPLSGITREQLKQLQGLFNQGSAWTVDDWQVVSLPESMLWCWSCQQIRASLAVPIELGGAFCGILIANECTGPRRWQTSETQLLLQLATQVGIAIQQANLYRQVQQLNATLEAQVEERTAQLQEKMQELEDLNQVKDAFLRAFSHELRTPIMGTLMVLRNLLDQPQPQVSLSRPMLEKMVQGNERQLNMANALIEAYSNETQLILLKPEPINLAIVLQELLDQLKPLFKRYQPQLNNLVPRDLSLLQADPVQVKCLYRNLLSNALQHNPTGVTLRLTADPSPTEVICRVHDDGVGIAPDQCQSLFNLHKSSLLRRYAPGLGLGLYLSRQIVEAHGGQIGVESRPGSGTTFWFTLPWTSPATLRDHSCL